MNDPAGRRCLMVALLAAWLGACVHDAAADDDAWLERTRQRLSSGVIRWGGDAEGNAPYQYPDPNDPQQVVGFEVEIADALADAVTRRLGRRVTFEFTQYEWVSLPLGLDKGDFDCILSGFEVTPENQAAVRFTRPYFIYAQQLTVRANETRIASLEDCRGRKIGTVGATAAFRLLERMGIESSEYNDQIGAYLDLENGRVDAVLLDWPVALYYASNPAKFKQVGPLLAPGQYAIALQPADVDLARLLDAALGDMIQSGQLAAILRKWKLWNVDQAQLARSPLAAEDLAGLGFDSAGKPRRDGADTKTGAAGGDAMANSSGGWTFDRYAPVLLKAAGMTVFLSVASMAVAMALGLLVAIARTYGAPPINTLALVYIEFFRGVPLLLVLTFIYYGLPAAAGIHIPAVAAAILGFGLNYAAYEAEIYRSAILSVPVGQWEAGRALGMSERLTFRRIIFPQALRTALGPMTNDFVAMFKDTSLVSVIAVEELTKEYLVLARSSLSFVELGLVTAALYLAMSVPLGYLSRWLEGRWGRH